MSRYQISIPMVYAPWCSRARTTGKTKGYAYIHIVRVEKALGHALPSEARVHHVDENRKNNRNSNLVACQDEAYHQLLHARMRVLRAGGDPNTDKICFKCKEVKNKKLFYNSFTRFDRLEGDCIPCTTIRNKERYL